MKWPYHLLLSCLVLPSPAWLATPAGAEVIMDGSLGPPGALAGPDYVIPADLGSQVGKNLFHSFADFTIGGGESATFSGPNTVTNIIARVSGGHESIIDGLLRSTIPQANLLLLNPAGVLFGPHASLDLPGSLHVSTADYLTLGPKGHFAAQPAGASALTIDPPAAFGFLGDNPAGISLIGNSSLVGAPNKIAVSEGETISIIGGNLEISATSLSTPAGRINLISMGAAGEVPCCADVPMPGLIADGELMISGGAIVDVSGTGGGEVFIRASHFGLTDAEVISETTADLPGQGIDLGATSIDITGAGGLDTTTYGSGAGGSITIRTESLHIKDNGFISALVGDQASGHGGDIIIHAADTVSLSEMGYLSATTWGPGAGGSILVDTPQLTMRDYGSLETGIGPGATGNSGSITVQAKTLNLTDEAYIASQVHPEASGHGGDITILGAESVSIGGVGYLSSTTVGSGDGGSILLETKQLSIGEHASIEAGQGAVGSGHGGDITIQGAETVNLTGAGKLDVSTRGPGDSGSITVQTKALTIKDGASLVGQVGLEASGQGGNITIQGAETVSLAGDGGLTVSTWGPGHSGSISVQAKDLSIRDNATLSASVMTGASGHGGDIGIYEAEVVNISGGRGISASTYGSGNAGSITVQTKALSVKDAAYIASEVGAGGSGDGGGISIQAAVQVGLSGDGMVSSSSYGTGDGGSVSIDTGTLTMTDHGNLQALAMNTGQGGNLELTVSRLVMDGGSISAESVGPGQAGQITVQATDSMALLDSAISTAAPAADGGNIVLNAGRMLHLEQSAITTSVQGGAGNGGNISIDPQYVILENSQIIAQAAGGNGGQIHLSANTFIQDPTSQISASSTAGIDGDVTVDAPNFDMSGALAVLPATFLSAIDLAGSNCAARQDTGRSSLVFEGGDTPRP